MIFKRNERRAVSAPKVETDETSPSARRTIDRLKVENLKNFGLKVNPEKLLSRDYFGNKFLRCPRRISGKVIILTSNGYYKNSWAVLNGRELYLYIHKNQPVHTVMHVL
jgi:hypothetical protein